MTLAVFFNNLKAEEKNQSQHLTFVHVQPPVQAHPPDQVRCLVGYFLIWPRFPGDPPCRFRSPFDWIDETASPVARGGALASQTVMKHILHLSRSESPVCACHAGTGCVDFIRLTGSTTKGRRGGRVKRAVLSPRTFPMSFIGRAGEGIGSSDQLTLG